MQIPTPQPSESQEDFVVRAHYALMAAIPEPMERNRRVWESWEANRGDVERERADRLFSEEQFSHKRDVCLWHEHEAQTVDATGQPVIRNNDVTRLAAIVRENNLRIADTDAYTALVDKHTLPPGMDDRGKEAPKTIGYVGPYRLGMIGRVTPKFAIFADEHHRLDRKDVLSDRPRRSVEVLTLKANGRSYIDPVAALSEAPRLPLPVQFSAASADDIEVDRYQAESVAAYPFAYVDRYEGEGGGDAGGSYAGGGNTYLPGADVGRRKQTQQYDADGNDPQNVESNSMLQPEDLKQIADAIMSTPQMQFVTQLMQQQDGGVGDPNSPDSDQGMGEDPTGAGGPPPAGAAPGGPPAPPAAAPPAPPAPGQPAPAQKEPYMQQPPAQRFSANESDEYELESDWDDSGSENYAALAESQRNLMERYAELSSRNAALEARAVDADRKTTLNELYSAHPHMVDLESEIERCCYSAGSTMDDEQFEAHCELIEQYASRAPAISPLVPGGDAPAQRSDRLRQEQYKAKISQRSVEIYTAALSAGNHKTADECWTEAEQEITRG